MKKAIIVLILVIVVMGVILVGINYFSPVTTPEPEEEIAPVPEDDEVEVFYDFQEGPLTIRIHSDELDPSSFTVTPGETVELRIVSMERGSYVWRFKETEEGEISWVGLRVRGAGASNNITFTSPRKEGSYEFFAHPEDRPEDIIAEGVMRVKSN